MAVEGISYWTQVQEPLGDAIPKILEDVGSSPTADLVMMWPSWT